MEVTLLGYILKTVESKQWEIKGLSQLPEWCSYSNAWQLTSKIFSVALGPWLVVLLHAICEVVLPVEVFSNIQLRKDSFLLWLKLLHSCLIGVFCTYLLKSALFFSRVSKISRLFLNSHSLLQCISSQSSNGAVCKFIVSSSEMRMKSVRSSRPREASIQPYCIPLYELLELSITAFQTWLYNRLDWWCHVSHSVFPITSSVARGGEPKKPWGPISNLQGRSPFLPISSHFCCLPHILPSRTALPEASQHQQLQAVPLWGVAPTGDQHRRPLQHWEEDPRYFSVPHVQERTWRFCRRG